MSVDFENLPIVTSPKLYVDKHYKIPHPEGILSQQIFGPLVSYQCQCKKLSTKILYNGVRCDECGVLCTSTTIRYTTFAKIKLLFKVIKKQKISIIQQWLKSKKTLLDPLQNGMYRTFGLYLKYNESNDSIEILDIFNPDDADILPLTITGIYTLYLALFCISKIHDSEKAIELLNCFTDEVLVTPPATRPSIVTDTINAKKGAKTILSSTLDEAYCKLLATDHHNIKYKDLLDFEGYYKMVLLSIERNTGIAICSDELKLFDEISSYYQYAYSQIYEIVNTLLSGKTGLIRNSFLGKNVDFSSRSVIIVDPKLLTYEIRIPKSTFLKLYFVEYLHFLQHEKKEDYKVLRQLIRNSETNTINENLLYVDEFVKYFFSKTRRRDRLVIMNRVPSLKF